MSTINLLPKDYLERRAKRRANMLCLALFGIVMTGVVTATVVSRRSGRHTQQVRNRVNRSYAKAAELIAQMQTLESRKRSMCDRAETTASLVERVPRSTLLAALANALPPGVSLTKLNLQTRLVRPRTTASDKKKAKGAKFKKKTEDLAPPRQVVEMEVTGLAETGAQVGRFMSSLGRNSLLDGVDLVFIQEKKVDDMVVREFAVKMELKTGADAIDAVTTSRGNSSARAQGTPTPTTLVRALGEGATR